MLQFSSHFESAQTIDELIEISELQGNGLAEAKQRYRDAQKIFAQQAADARGR